MKKFEAHVTGTTGAAVRYVREVMLPGNDSAQESLASRARIVNALSVRMSDVGKREEALELAQEAVSIYRQLVEQRPDAVVPDLDRALAMAGRTLREDRLTEAIPYFEEGVRILAPFFLRLPEAHEPLMRTICGMYWRAAKADRSRAGPGDAAANSGDTREARGARGFLKRRV